MPSSNPLDRLFSDPSLPNEIELDVVERFIGMQPLLPQEQIQVDTARVINSIPELNHPAVRRLAVERLHARDNEGRPAYAPNVDSIQTAKDLKASLQYIVNNLKTELLDDEWDGPEEVLAYLSDETNWLAEYRAERSLEEHEERMDAELVRIEELLTEYARRNPGTTVEQGEMYLALQEARPDLSFDQAMEVAKRALDERDRYRADSTSIYGVAQRAADAMGDELGMDVEFIERPADLETLINEATSPGRQDITPEEERALFEEAGMIDSPPPSQDKNVPLEELIERVWRGETGTPHDEWAKMADAAEKQAEEEANRPEPNPFAGTSGHFDDVEIVG